MATEAVSKPETTKLETAIEQFRGEIKTLAIKTAGDYERAGQILVALKNYEKDVHTALDPFVEIPRRAYEAARQERQKWLNAAEELRGRVSAPMADFKRAERIAAEAEEKRINEERRREAERQAEADRKAAEAQAEADRKEKEKEIEAARKAGDLNKKQADKMKKDAAADAVIAKEAAAEQARLQTANVQTVTVKPAVPTVAGLRARVNWKFRITDASRLPRKYLIPNEVLIGRDVREWKDKEATEKAIPGVEVYTEDSI